MTTSSGLCGSVRTQNGKHVSGRSEAGQAKRGREAAQAHQVGNVCLGIEHGIRVLHHVQAGYARELLRELAVERGRRRRAEGERVREDAREHQPGDDWWWRASGSLGTRIQDAASGAEGAHVHLERRVGLESAQLVVIDDGMN